MEDLEAVIASLSTMEDGFKIVSSQEENTIDDDTPISSATRLENI